MTPQGQPRRWRQQRTGQQSDTRALQFMAPGPSSLWRRPLRHGLDGAPRAWQSSSSAGAFNMSGMHGSSATSQFHDVAPQQHQQPDVSTSPMMSPAAAAPMYRAPGMMPSAPDDGTASDATTFQSPPQQQHRAWTTSAWTTTAEIPSPAAPSASLISSSEQIVKATDKLNLNYPREIGVNGRIYVNKNT